MQFGFPLLPLFLVMGVFDAAAMAATLDGGFFDSRFGSYRVNTVAQDGLGRLVMGGSLQLQDNRPAGGVWRFDGVRWEALGGSPPALLLARGDRVYAASQNFAPNITVYENGVWTPLGGDVNSRVRCMTWLGSDILIGGHFSFAGNAPLSRIGRWDGAAWRNIGAGLSNPVTSIATDGSNIFAVSSTGIFSTVMRWNGVEWSQIAFFGAGTAAALHCQEGALYVGGSFSAINGDTAINRLAIWRDGVWSQWGDGQLSGIVQDIAEFDGNLFVSGDITHAPSSQRVALAEFEGDGWIPHLSSIAVQGLGMLALEDELLVRATASPELNGNILRGHSGLFRYRTAGDWSVFGPLGAVDTIFMPDRFKQLIHTPEGVMVSTSYDAASAPAPLIWNGARFRNTYATLRQDGASVQMQTAMTSQRGVTFCHGIIGGETLTHALFAFRSGAWEQATGPLPEAPAALAANDHEIVATQSNRVLAWDGAEWRQRGPNLGSPRSLSYFKGDLYVGGVFTREPDVRAIARWDGAEWVGLGRGLFYNAVPKTAARVNALHATKDKLFVGGLFDSASGGAATNLATWTGTSWEAAPGFFNESGAVFNIARSDDGVLAIAGDFQFVDGFEVSGFAIHDGAAWKTPPLRRTWTFGGMQLLWHGHDLHMTGRFQMHGTVSSFGYAIWRHPGVVLKAVRASDRRFYVQATGATPPRYEMQSSPDLENWTSETANYFGENPSGAFSMTSEQRFFGTAFP